MGRTNWFIDDEEMDNDEEAKPIVNSLDIEVWLEMLVDFFLVKVQLDDLVSHSMLDGSSKHRDSCVKTLKVKVKWWWRQ